MRTIIISDTTETSNNVIPYGLNIGKYTETKVNVLHLIDPQLLEGPYSSYSDSQTFSPSEKLSHEQILEREKVSAELEIDRVLSREGSRLNYPLRIEHQIEITDTENTLNEILSSHENPLLVTAASPSKSSVKELSEILKIGRNNNTPVLVVPTGKRFLKPETALMITTLSESDTAVQQMVFNWIKPFGLAIDVFVAGDEHTEDQAENWKQEIFPDDPLLINEVTLLNENPDLNQLNRLIEDNKPDLVLLPLSNQGVFGSYFLEEKRAKDFVDQTGKPVLFF
jgi:hypothetical protein